MTREKSRKYEGGKESDMENRLASTTREQEKGKMSKIKTTTTTFRGGKSGDLIKKFTTNISNSGPANYKDGCGEKVGKLRRKSQVIEVTTPTPSTSLRPVEDGGGQGE